MFAEYASLGQITTQTRQLLEGAIQDYGTFSMLAELTKQLNAECLSLDQPLKVAIVGRFSCGKSTMLNALLGECVVPMDVNIATATVNCFCYGDERELEVHWYGGHVTREPYEMLFEYAQHRGESQQRQAQIEYVNVYYPYPALKQVMIIDTPGLDALVQTHVEATKRMLQQVDAVIYLFNGVPREEDKKTLDAFLREHRSKTLGVLTKADMLPREEQKRIIEHAMRFVREHVSDILPISGQMALGARLLDESQLDLLKRIYGSLSEAEWEDLTLDADTFNEELPEVVDGVSEAVCTELSKSLTMEGIRRLRPHLDGDTSLETCRERLLMESELPALEALLHERIFAQRDLIKVHQVLWRVSYILQRNEDKLAQWREREEARLDQIEGSYRTLLVKTTRHMWQPQVEEIAAALEDLMPLVGEILHEKREQVTHATRKLMDYPAQVGQLIQDVKRVQSQFQTVQRVYETRWLPRPEKEEALRILGETASALPERLGLPADATEEAIREAISQLKRKWMRLTNQGISRDEREIGDAIAKTLNMLRTDMSPSAASKHHPSEERRAGVAVSA